jgi:hypothetical protein
MAMKKGDKETMMNVVDWSNSKINIRFCQINGMKVIYINIFISKDCKIHWSFDKKFSFSLIGKSTFLMNKCIRLVVLMMMTFCPPIPNPLLMAIDFTGANRRRECWKKNINIKIE